MIIFGWIIWLLFTLYMSLIFVIGNIGAGALTGKSLGLFPNLFLLTVVGIMWYIVVTSCPFVVAVVY